MSEVAHIPASISWDDLERIAAEGPTDANIARLKAVVAAIQAELPEVMARTRANGRPMLACEAWLARREAAAADPRPWRHHPAPIELKESSMTDRTYPDVVAAWRVDDPDGAERWLVLCDHEGDVKLLTAPSPHPEDLSGALVVPDQPMAEIARKLEQLGSGRRWARRDLVGEIAWITRERGRRRLLAHRHRIDRYLELTIEGRGLGQMTGERLCVPMEILPEVAEMLTQIASDLKP